MRFVPGAPPHLAIRAQYRLANVGNAPLHFIGVQLPGDKSFGRANLHAEINGKEITPEHNPAEAADDWRVPMPVAWRQKEKLNLALSYDLAAQSATDPRVFVAANTFYLNDSGWPPALMGFKSILSSGIVRPNPTDLSVIVPADFRVTASGQLHGTRKQNGEIEYRFRIGVSDFDPYVLAGLYHEQRVPSADVTFWTAQALPADLQRPASALAQAFQFYTHFLGPPPRDNTTIYVINTDTAPMEREFLTAFEDVPPSTIVTGQSLNNAAFAAEFPTHAAEESLAATWFTHLVKPRPEAWPLASGLEAYAADLADQQRANGTSRAAEITSRLLQFTKVNEMAVESPVESLTPDAAPAQVGLSEIKVVLFLFALEDKCGRENLEHAIAHMVYALRGQEYGYTDLRAALEQECHQDLSSMFAAWLDQKGIPADFRTRYDKSDSVK